MSVLICKVVNPAIEQLEKRKKELEAQLAVENQKYRKIYNPFTFVQYLAGGLEISLIVKNDFEIVS